MATEQKHQTRRSILGGAILREYGSYFYAQCTYEETLAWLMAGPSISALQYIEAADALEQLTGLEIACPGSVSADSSRRLADQALLTQGDHALIFRVNFPRDYRPTYYRGSSAGSSQLEKVFIRENAHFGVLTRLNTEFLPFQNEEAATV